MTKQNLSISTSTPKQRGFTLVELLVALAIMAIMAALSWRGLEVMLRSREITQKRVDEVAAFQNVMRQWDADLNAVFPLSGSATATASVTTSVTTSAPAGSPTSAPSTQAQVMAIDWDGRVLRIMRRSSTPNPEGKDSGLNVVGWTMRDNMWVRWQSPDLTRSIDLINAWSQVTQWAQNPGSESKQYETQLIGSSGWQIYYFRDNAWSNPLSSSGSVNNANTSTPSSAMSGVPDGIRIEIQLPQSLGGTLVKDWVRPSFSINRS